MGLMYNNAFWVFCRSTETFERLSQLKGKRIAVGPEGSGTRYSAEQVLGAAGVTSTTATFLSYGGTAASDALRNGKVDVAWVVGGTDAIVVKTLLHTSDVRLMNFPMADAFTRIIPGLVRLVLPQGVVDIEGNIPPNDVPLLATTNRLLIRDDLHPAIVQLLLKTVMEVHGGQDIFQRIGEFPTKQRCGISHGRERRRLLQEWSFIHAAAFAFVADRAREKGDCGAGDRLSGRHPIVQFCAQAVPVVSPRPHSKIVSPPQDRRRGPAKSAYSSSNLSPNPFG